jgi:hypothetical protein
VIDKLTLGCLVLFHGFIVGGNIVSFFVVPFLEPFYVSIPIMSLVLLLVFSRVLDCPLTNWENRIRQRLGMKRIGGFTGHYLIKPWRRSWGKKKT